MRGTVRFDAGRRFVLLALEDIGARRRRVSVNRWALAALSKAAQPSGVHAVSKAC